MRILKSTEVLPVLWTSSWVVFMVLHISHGQLDFFVSETRGNRCMETVVPK